MEKCRPAAGRLVRHHPLLSETDAERAFDAFRAATPARVWVPVRQALKRAGVA